MLGTPTHLDCFQFGQTELSESLTKLWMGFVNYRQYQFKGRCSVKQPFYCERYPHRRTCKYFPIAVKRLCLIKYKRHLTNTQWLSLNIMKLSKEFSTSHCFEKNESLVFWQISSLGHKKFIILLNHPVNTDTFLFGSIFHARSVLKEKILCLSIMTAIISH